MSDRIEGAFTRLSKLKELNAPSVILGHSALILACHCLCGGGSFKKLARWILEHEQSVTNALNPESEEARDMAEIEKDLDDDALERAAYLSEV